MPMINNVAKNKLTIVITTREIAFPAALPVLFPFGSGTGFNPY